MAPKENNRILVVVDNLSTHDDYRRMLGAFVAEGTPTVPGKEKPKPHANIPLLPAADRFSITFSHQVREALDMVRRALVAGEPLALAILDIDMGPRGDGIKAAHQLWEADPELQVAICSAHSEYGWSHIVTTFGRTDRLLLLRKPLHDVELM